MLCQKCHKNLATVRYAEVVDGKVTDRHLCADCLAQHQDNAAKGFELTGVAPTARKIAVDQVVREAVKLQRTCATCGATLTMVMDEARTGCAKCYENFSEQIESMLEGLQRSMQHKGKMPHLDDARAKLRGDLQTKRALLRTMLRAEKYEEAARLRDEIRGLETGLYVSESGVD
jgi:protein arginine kinase activator